MAQKNYETAELLPIFDLFKDKKTLLAFGKNELAMTFIRAEKAKVGALHNAPDKLPKADGTGFYTPPVISLVFMDDDSAECTLDIVVQDIDEVTRTFSGVAVTVGEIVYQVTLCV